MRGERVVISTSSFGADDSAPLATLGIAGLDVVSNPHRRTLSETEVTELLTGAVGIIAGTEPLTRAVMEGAPSLRVISRLGAGMDNVDLAAADELGVRVFNTPGGPSQAVAELALALTLDVLRGVSRADRRVRTGAWKKEMGALLSGKTVGIVGFGSVGRAFAALLEPFACEVLACDPAVQPGDDETSAEPCDLEGLLARADVVSLHCSYCEADHHLLSRERIGRMKPGAILVNTARGGLIDEDALIGALNDGHLAGAALDVFEREPYEGPLVSCENVVLSPHVGSYAREARIRMERDAVRNLLVGLGLAEETG